MSSAQSIGNSIYEGSAELGRVQSYMGLIVVACISIILIIVAFYLFSIDESNLIDIDATILNASCVGHIVRSGRNTSQQYACNLQVKYLVDGKEYVGNVTTDSSSMYTTGATFPVSYDVKNPSNVQQKKFRDKYIAYILCGIAVCLMGASFINYYFVSHSKVYAALSGANAVRHVF